MTGGRALGTRAATALSWTGIAMLVAACGPVWPAGSWSRHTIDDSSLGTDGVRLADADGDGLLDVVTPWEQGGAVRLYLNPGVSGVRDRWPAVTVGDVGDPEDAFLADVNGDGALDVVSSCEGEPRSIYVHWAPRDASSLLDSRAWTTAELPASAGAARWMFAFPMQVDGKHGVDIVAGAKGHRARIGWFESPGDPRELAAWGWHPLCDAGWIMTIRPSDLDADGHDDIVATDRMGPRRGAFWLENPGPWTEHWIRLVDEHEAMHNAVSDLDGDGLDDVLVAVKGGPVRFHRRAQERPPLWLTHLIEMPPGTGTGKSVKAADMDLDGRPDSSGRVRARHGGPDRTVPAVVPRRTDGGSLGSAFD